MRQQGGELEAMWKWLVADAETRPKRHRLE